MNLIIGLIIITIAYILLADVIRKYPIPFYLGTYLMIAIVVLYYQMKLYKTMPMWFTEYIVDIFYRGLFSTITFIIVMYLGTIVKHNKITRRLYKIRGELSIIGCFAALCHNVAFGIKYFTEFFTNPKAMTTVTFIATIISIVLIVIMIPLMITSFKCVRKKMKAKTWKNLQRFAYPFYFLIYAHVMVLYSIKIDKFLVSIIAYTVIYLLYAILRIRKYVITRNKKSNKKLATS